MLQGVQYSRDYFLIVCRGVQQMLCAFWITTTAPIPGVCLHTDKILIRECVTPPCSFYCTSHGLVSLTLSFIRFCFVPFRVSVAGTGSQHDPRSTHNR